MQTDLKSSRKVLAITMVALADRKITIKQANALQICAGDFNTLAGQELKLLKSGKELSFDGTPDLRPLIDMLEQENFAGAVAEAKNIRSKMKLILQRTKDRLKT